jgi:pimeloyl-ACP methyl ester carboxylesterase
LIPRFGLAGALVFVLACGSAGDQAPSSQRNVRASPSPHPLESCVVASDLAQAVVFQSSKGEKVVGAVLGTGETGLVLAHKVSSDLCEWLPYAKKLRDMGRRVLIFDFGSDPVADVVGAVAELRREGVTKVVLVGASMGGTATLVAASIITPPVSGVASLSGPKYYSGMDAMAASKQLTVRIIYMAAQDDEDFPADARAMYAGSPSVQKQLVILPGADHGSDLLLGNAAAQARTALEQFIAGSTA